MKLSKQDRDLLKSIENGADIYGYGEAVDLSHMEKMGLVTITQAMNPPDDVHQKQPYFGCILNGEGRKVLKANKAKL